VQLIAFFRNPAGQVAVELPRLCERVAQVTTNLAGHRIDPVQLAIIATGRTFEGTAPNHKTARRQLGKPDTAMIAALYQLADDHPEVWVHPHPCEDEEF
jgi:hypothetical protein